MLQASLCRRFQTTLKLPTQPHNTPLPYHPLSPPKTQASSYPPYFPSPAAAAAVALAFSCSSFLARAACTFLPPAQGTHPMGSPLYTSEGLGCCPCAQTLTLVSVVSAMAQSASWVKKPVLGCVDVDVVRVLVVQSTYERATEPFKTNVPWCGVMRTLGKVMSRMSWSSRTTSSDMSR